METVRNIFESEIVQRLGWTLVHFVWQAAAAGLILAVVLRLLRKSSANLRYVIACAALALIVLMPVVTFRVVKVEQLQPTIQAQKYSTAEVPSTALRAGSENAEDIKHAENRNQKTAARIENDEIDVRVGSKLPTMQSVGAMIEPALPYIVGGWLMGVFGLSLWHLGGWTQLQRLRRQMVKEVAPVLKEKLQQLSDALGIGKTINLLESALVQVPTVIGHLRPVILLPVSALTGLSPEQIEAILAHELAHIKRCDYLVNILQTVVEILGFYHPAVWWISHKIRVERENCCDDMAVSVCSDKVCYAKALTTMEEIRATQPGLAVAASGGSLFDRIRRLLGKDSANEGKLSWLPSVIAILLIGALLIPTALALSSEKLEVAEGITAQQLQQLVEDFFKHNYRDITSRKTVEWGEPVTDANGNVSISYKYEMIIWDKDKFLANEIFTFDKDGKFVKVEKVEGFPKSLGTVAVPPEDVSTKEAVQKLVEKFFTRNYHDITSRKTLEWGEPVYDTNNGNVSIRYKYEATIWEKDKIISDKLFNFDKNGEFVSVGDVEQIQKEKGSSASSGFKTILANGVTVELVGVCEYPSEGKQWWKPDGSLLKEAMGVKIYDKIACNIKQPVKGNPYVFVVRVDGPADLNFKWGQTEDAACLASGKPMDAKGREIEDMQAVQANIDERKANAALRLAVASGPWKNKAAHNGKGIMSVNLEGGAVTFSEAYESNGGVKITVSDTLDEFEHRIAAVDAKGNLLQAIYKPWVGAGKIRQTTPRFENLRLDQIKEFQFQIRPYEWVTFKNVSLKPGNKTDVQIEVKEPNSQVEEQKNISIEDGTLEAYIVCFKPISSFQPQTAKELLDAFNSIVNFKVTTHDFRTMVQDGNLFGYILSDSEAAAKDIATMLKESNKLEFMSYRAGTQEDLTRHYAMDQPGLKDIDIKISDFDIRSNEKRGVFNLVVSIQSESNTTIPKFKLRFYRGDPKNNLDETGNVYSNVHNGWHEAGPIESGKIWNERTRDFHLPDGQYEFNVVLYFGESIININSGCAELKVKVQDGKTIEKFVDLNPLNKETGQVEKKTDQQEPEQIVEQDDMEVIARKPSGQVISTSDFGKDDANVEKSKAEAAEDRPEFVIKGKVTDAETGRPIAGAKVGDVERYAEGKQWTTTDANGGYSYKTWYEEHDVKCEASGYKTQNKVLLTKLFSKEKEKVLDFALESENATTGALNESQKLYAQWTEERFGNYLDRSQYADLSDSTKTELEGEWLKLLEEPENEKFYDAINGLAAIKSKKAIKPLLRIATERVEKDNRNRWMAVRALGIIGDESAVPELIPLVYHYNQNTRFWAQISLVRLTGENFGNDWQKWAGWWNSQKDKPACSTEKVEWTSNPDWADPEKQKKMDEETIGRLRGDKKGETDKKSSSGTSREPVVVRTTPAAYADDVSPKLKKITVTFDRPMMDQSWSWTGGVVMPPKKTSDPYYDSSKTTCTLPVKLEAGKVYWVGINSPSAQGFKSADGISAKRYVILFATKGADGKATAIPEDMLAKAKSINEQPEKTGEEAEVEQRRAKLRIDFEKRMARDKKIYSEQELSEIEQLYQVANKKWNSQEAEDSLEKLIARYAKANRTGCAVLYLGQMSEGEQKEEYLKRAIKDFGDCMYGDGVRVGTFARYLLAMHYKETGKEDEAKRLIAELIKDYPDAVGHNGELLIEQIPEDLKAGTEAEHEDKNIKQTKATEVTEDTENETDKQKNEAGVEGPRPKIVSVIPPQGTEMPLISELQLVFDQTMMPDKFEIYDASMQEKYKHTSQARPVRSCAVYDVNTYKFTIPLFLPCNWNGTIKLEGFKSNSGVEMEPVTVRYSTLREPFSAELLKRFETVRKRRELKDVLTQIKKTRMGLNSLKEVIYKSLTLGVDKKEEKIDKVTIKMQGEKQFYADMSESFEKTWIIGSDGQTCWFYNEYKEGGKLVVLDYNEIEQKNISICNLFGLGRAGVEEAAAFNNLEYAGRETFDGKNCHIIRGWNASVRGDRALCIVNTWLIDAETYLPLKILQETSYGELNYRFEYERINQVFDNSEFKPESVTSIAGEPEEPLGEGYETRFITIVDGTETGKMSVRWGKEGSKGTVSSGLN